MAPLTGVADQKLTLPENTFTPQSGKTFGGWNTKSDGSGDSFNPNEEFKITGDKTLYAIWVVATYTAENYDTLTIFEVYLPQQLVQLAAS